MVPKYKRYPRIVFKQEEFLEIVFLIEREYAKAIRKRQYKEADHFWRPLLNKFNRKMGRKKFEKVRKKTAKSNI